MRCTKCHGKTGTADSRPSDVTVKRIRFCKQCGFRWTTFEISGETFERLTARRASTIGIMRHLREVGVAQ